VLTVAGVSGAWMANLRALAPYQPIFIALSIAVLGYGFYLVYWKPKRASADGAVCAQPVIPDKVVQGTLWLATLIVILAISFIFWFPLIVPYLP
jgi:mercuric ion transport protein